MLSGWRMGGAEERSGGGHGGWGRESEAEADQEREIDGRRRASRTGKKVRKEGGEAQRRGREATRTHGRAEKRRGGRVHAGGNVETLTCQEGNLEGGGPSRICIRIEPWLGQKGKQQTG